MYFICFIFIDFLQQENSKNNYLDFQKIKQNYRQTYKVKTIYLI